MRKEVEVATQTKTKAFVVEDPAKWCIDVIHNPPMLRLDGTVSYVDGWALLVPAGSGVYFIHDLRGVIYIGRTHNLNVRFGQHVWCSHNRGLTAALKHAVGQMQFFWLTCEEELAVKLERDYIRAFQPLTNAIRYENNRDREVTSSWR
jgi:predicted GIY-YIG superfamily endonuclease